MPILVYHNIALKSDNELTVDIFHFLRDLFFLKNKKIVFLKEYNPNDENQYVIRFDDAYKSLRYVAPILKLFAFPFEVFIVNKFYQEAQCGNKEWCNKDDFKYIVKAGGRLQYHSNSHPDLTVCKNLADEIVVPQDLKQLDPDGFDFFAYPFWKYNQEIIAFVKQHYKGALSGNGHADNTIYSLDGIKMNNKYKLRIK